VGETGRRYTSLGLSVCSTRPPTRYHVPEVPVKPKLVASVTEPTPELFTIVVLGRTTPGPLCQTVAVYRVLPQVLAVTCVVNAR